MEESPGNNKSQSQSDTIDIVPESPPLQSTQSQSQDSNDIEDISDGEFQVLPVTSPSSWSSNSVKKNNDCVINIESDTSDDEVPGTRPPFPGEGDGKPKYEDKDIVIEECLSSTSGDEFADGDDALLLIAAKKAEEESRRGLAEGGNSGGVVNTVGNGDEVNTLLEMFDTDGDTDSAPKKEEMTLDARIKADDDTRRAILDTFQKFKPMDKIYPDVRISEHNTVAFKLKANYIPNAGEVLEPHPPTCMPKWDPKFVPMPFCDDNVVLLKNPNPEPGNDKPVLKRIHLWNRIKTALETNPILCVEDFVTTLKRYTKIPEKLKALSRCIENLMSVEERTNFFEKVIPFMTSLILRTSEIVTCPLPILRRNVNHNISMTQNQAACLLANAFFCTFPKRFQSEEDMPSINFKELFNDGDQRAIEVKAQKILFLIKYFTRVTTEMPTGVITFTRKNLRHSLMPDWEKIDKGLTKLLPLIQGTIEDDGVGLLKVDFANSFIGGGALGRGAVQEEILFLIYPELMLSRLFCEKMNSNEAVIITGCERFTNYKGYSYSLTYDGDYCDTTPFDSKGRRCTQIVAIDALYISRPSFQYNPKHFRREVNKAFVGFCAPVPNPVGIATGKWGCGAFNGDPHLKAIIQLLAASHAGRDVAFFTFGDVQCMEDIMIIYNSISDMKIKDVWNLLCQYHTICCSTSTPSRSLKDFCQQFADGKLWQMQQEQTQKQAEASTSKKLGQVPLTKFYASEKRQTLLPALDDDSVAQIINGIDRINSPKKLYSAGKRQREDELNEDDIKEELQNDDNDAQTATASTTTTPKVSSTTINRGAQRSQTATAENGNNKDEDAVTSPKSSKRPKRLELADFYKDPTSD